MPPTARKSAKSNAPSLAHTTFDALHDAFGTHRTEALAGRASQAVKRALDALHAPDVSPRSLVSVVNTALVLARSKHRDEALRIVEAACALPRPLWASERQLDEWAAVRAAHVAAVHLALGDTQRANASIDEALALVPAWTAPPAYVNSPVIPEADAAGVAAIALLDVGRVDIARSVLDNLHTSSIREATLDAARRGDVERLDLFRRTARPGQLTFGENIAAALLDHGHAALFDACVSEVVSSPFLPQATKVQWSMRRLLADGVGAFDISFVERLRAIAEGATSAARATLRGLADSLPYRRRAGLEGLDALYDALHEALFEDRAMVTDAHDHWFAVRALREGGRDVTALVERAATPNARATAAATLMDTTASGEPLRARLVAYALAVDPTTVATMGAEWGCEALAALLRAGETEAGASIALEAAKALRSSPSYLAALAGAAMIGGDLALGAKIAAKATSAKRAATLSGVRARMAEEGTVDQYWTASQSAQPAEFERDRELARMIERGLASTREDAVRDGTKRS